MLSLIGVAVPVFFLAFLLKYWFAVESPIFPVSGRQDAALGCTRVTGFFVLDGLLTREFDCSATRCATWCCPRSRSRPSPSR